MRWCNAFKRQKPVQKRHAWGPIVVFLPRDGQTYCYNPIMPKLLSVGKLTEPLSCSEWHSHPSWEICLFTDGEGVVQIDHRKIPFSPGSIICYPPEVPHSEHSA